MNCTWFFHAAFLTLSPLQLAVSPHHFTLPLSSFVRRVLLVAFCKWRRRRQTQQDWSASPYRGGLSRFLKYFPLVKSLCQCYLSLPIIGQECMRSFIGEIALFILRSQLISWLNCVSRSKRWPRVRSFKTSWAVSIWNPLTVENCRKTIAHSTRQ